MSVKFLRKYGETGVVNFPLFEVDGVDFRVDAVYAAGDIKVSKDEGAEANTTNGFTDEGTGYALTLTATELTAKRIVLYLVDQTATKVWLDDYVIVETYGHADAMHAFNLDYDLSGNNETWKLKQLDVTNSSGDAVIAKSTGGNGTGFFTEGNGSGHGSEHKSGNGVSARGVYIYSRGSGGYAHGLAITAIDGNAVDIDIPTTYSGHGLHIRGRGTGKHGIFGESFDAIGIKGVGGGVYPGIMGKGGSTGDGAVFEGGASGGNGYTARAVAGNGNGATFQENGTGLPINPAIGGLSLSDTVDGVTIENIFTYQLSMINGKFIKNFPNPGDIRFYKQDNTTTAFTTHFTDTQRTRL